MVVILVELDANLTQSEASSIAGIVLSRLQMEYTRRVNLNPSPPPDAKRTYEWACI
jgi:hypothetical protein